MAIKDFIIRGVFQDGITSALNGMVGGMNRVAAAAKSASMAMARMGSGAARGIHATTAALNTNTKAWMANARASRASQAIGGMWGRGPPRGGAGWRRSWTPVQQSLAATGGAGYALGRGGAGTVGLVGSGMLAYASLKRFASFESELTKLAKAANMSRAEAFEFGGEFQKIAKQYGLKQNDVAGMAAQVALGGVQKEGVKPVTESAAKAMLLWDDVDAKEVSNVMARTASRWYAGKKPAELQQLMDQFVGTVDFFEDKYPTAASDIIKGYYRFMSTAKLSGMTPEQAVAQVATMTTLGEPSGERAGTRLGTNWDRIGGVMTGAIKKKGMSLKGIDTKGLSETLNTNSQMAVFQFLDQTIERNVPAYVKELTKKGMKPEEARKEARKRASRDAKNFISKALGYETAKNLNPFIADYYEALLQASVTNKDLTKWALGNTGFVEYLKGLGDAGEQLLKDLQAFSTSAPDVTTIAGGQVKQNLNLMQQKLETKAKQFQASWDRWLTAVGSDLAPEAIAAMDSLGLTLDKNSAGIEKGGTVIGNVLRKNRLRGSSKGTNLNSVLTPWVPEGETQSFPSVSPMGKDGGAFDASGRPISGGILDSRDNSQRWAPGDGETRDQIDKYFPDPTATQTFLERMKLLYGAATAPQSFVQGLVGKSPNVAGPGMIGGLVGPQAVPGPGTVSGLAAPQVIPGPPQTVTVPFTASASQSGHVQVDVKVTQQPTVTIQGAGANVGTGTQGDSPSGKAQ